MEIMGFDFRLYPNLLAAGFQVRSLDQRWRVSERTQVKPWGLVGQGGVGDCLEDDPWDWYVYLNKWLIFCGQLVGKYTSFMDPTWRIIPVDVSG